MTVRMWKRPIRLKPPSVLFWMRQLRSRSPNLQNEKNLLFLQSEKTTNTINSVIMKKVIAVFAAALVGLSAYAQIGLSVGGSFGFTYSSAKRDGNKVSDGASFKFVPEIGFDLSKNITVGASMGYMHGYAALGSFSLTDFKSLVNVVVGAASDLGLTDDTGNKLNGFSFSPFVRFSFLQTKWVDLFVEGGPGYNLVNFKELKYDAERDKDVWVSTNAHIIEFAARPGVALKLGDQFKITAKIGALGWQTAFANRDNTKATLNRVGFDIDSNNILLGFSYRF